MAYSPAGLWTPKQTLEVAGRLSSAYLNAPPKALLHGSQFYPEWKATAQHIATHIGQSEAHGAALMAQLSPANEAELNRIQSLGLVHGGMVEGSRNVTRINKAAEAAGRAKSFEVKARSQKEKGEKALEAGDTVAHSRHMEEHGRFMEQYAVHSAENKRLRGLIGGLDPKSGPKGAKGTSPLAGIPSGFLAKAVNIREGTVKDPLGSLGDVKIGDFGRMIHGPETYNRPPIDTHYHDAALRRYDIPYQGTGSERGLDTKSRYEGFQGAHAMAHSMVAEELGVAPTHSAMMGAVWYAHQMQKALVNPGSLSARRAAETKVANIRRQDRFKAWMPESHGLAPSFGKIETQ